MSAELAKLLLLAGVRSSEVERVLEVAAERATNLPAAIAGERPELLELLDRELARAELASLELVRPEPALLSALPQGLCERLGALPVRQDQRSGRIDVAAVDPLDPHVALELEHHLDAPVRVLRVRFESFDAALRSGPLGATRAPSGPPLPLVRKPAQPSPDVLDGQNSHGRSGSDEEEPVLSLTRSKPRPAPPVPARLPAVEALDVALGRISRAHHPDEVVSALVATLRPAPTVILAIRGPGYEGRSGSAGLQPQSVRRIRIPAGVPSVAETALREGYYLGKLPFTPVHAGLREALGQYAEEEVYVALVTVSNRPSLVVLVVMVQDLGPSVDATRRVDVLARSAGQALESIVVSKKRGGAA